MPEVQQELEQHVPAPDETTPDGLRDDLPVKEWVKRRENPEYAAEAAEADEEAKETGERPRRLGGWQRKIQKQDQIIQRQQEQIDSLLKGNGKTAEEPQAQTTQQQPQAEQRAAANGQQSDMEVAVHLKPHIDKFAAQVEEAKKEFADFHEVALNPDLPVSNPMMDAIVTSDLGARIIYELGKDPEEAERIARLQPWAAIREIGKIESRIAAAIDEPRTTGAPAAIQPVRKATGTNHGEPSDSEPAEKWIKWRQKQVNNKNRSAW